MAGVSTKEIKNRIRSMESTKQITKAMEMVAASKLRHAQAQIANSRPYFEIIYDAIQDIVNTNTKDTLPYLHPPRSAKSKSLYVVIAGDRGLAGGYNSNILKLSYGEMLKTDSAVLPIGKKAVDFFHARGTEMLTEKYSQAESMSVGDCFSVARSLCNAFLSGEYDSVSIAYTTFASVLSQKPQVLKLLPLETEKKSKTESKDDILYEPGSGEVFRSIIPEYIGGVIYGALCECRASEQAARRMAMDTATQNAEDMIADLSLKYNQARQAAITQEITEIVAGI